MYFLRLIPGAVAAEKFSIFRFYHPDLVFIIDYLGISPHGLVVFERFFCQEDRNQETLSFPRILFIFISSAGQNGSDLCFFLICECWIICQLDHFRDGVARKGF